MYYTFVNSTTCNKSDRLPIPINSCITFDNTTMAIKNDWVYFYNTDDLNCKSKELASYPLNTTGGCNVYPPISIKFIQNNPVPSTAADTKKLSLMILFMIFMIIFNLLFVHM